MFTVILVHSKRNKNAVLPQENRAMPQLFFSVYSLPTTALEVYKSSQPSKARLQSSKYTGTKTEFNAKWRFKVIQGHVFWSQWKGDKALSNTKY